MCAKLIGFNYQSIADGDLRRELKETAAAIRSIEERMANDMITIGRYLTRIRNKLAKGEWYRWLEAEFEFSRSAAHGYMKVAEKFANADGLGNFQRSALRELSKDFVPEKARDECKAIAAAGKTVTRQTARTVIARHDADRPKPYNAFVPKIAGVESTDLHRLRSSVKTIVKRCPSFEREKLCEELVKLVREVIEEILLADADAGAVSGPTFDVDMEEATLAAGVV